MNRHFVFIVVLAVWASRPSIVSASENALVLRVDDPERFLDSDALIHAVGRDLGVRVVGESDHPLARIHVRVASARAEIEVVGDAGTRTRVVDLPAERDEAVRVLALVTTNLAREESAELIAALGLVESDVGASGETVPTEPGTGLTAAAPTPLDPSPARATAHVSAEDGHATEEDEPRAPLEPADRTWRIGFVHHVGAAAVNEAAQGFHLWGLELAHTPIPQLTFGLTDIAFAVGAWGGTGIDTTLFLSVSGTAFGELSSFVDSRIQLYGRLGVALQGRTETELAPGVFGAALYLGGGARFFATPALYFGVELGMHLVLTDGYSFGNAPRAYLTQWTTPGSVVGAVGWAF